MSNPIQSVSTPTGEFQMHFGSSPASSDLATLCKQWEKLCADLLAERQKLRDELAQMRWEYDACRKSLFQLKCKDYTPPNITDEEALAYADERPSIQELIAELQNAPEK